MRNLVLRRCVCADDSHSAPGGEASTAHAFERGVDPSLVPAQKADCMSVTASLATVTVTHHPDLVILRMQLEQLPGDALRIVVDNASPEPLRVHLRALVTEANATLIENDANLGLAAATNVG